MEIHRLTEYAKICKFQPFYDRNMDLKIEMLKLKCLTTGCQTLSGRQIQNELDGY